MGWGNNSWGILWGRLTVPLYFQDAAGNPIAGGYVLIRLNSDAKAPSGLVSSRTVRVDIDNTGLADTSSLQIEAQLTANLAHTPKYVLTAYTATGQLVLGPAFLTDLL